MKLRKNSAPEHKLGDFILQITNFYVEYLQVLESWPSGLRQRFAKPRGPKKPHTGSNPVLSALDFFYQILIS